GYCKTRVGDNGGDEGESHNGGGDDGGGDDGGGDDGGGDDGGGDDGGEVSLTRSTNHRAGRYNAART
ncbi:hypothetical protein FHG87_024262, partial [Trinorchestia longiramus]